LSIILPQINTRCLPAFLKHVCCLAFFVLTVSTISAQLLTTIAGNGTAGFSGDGGTALNARFNLPVGMCFDPSGNMYIADYGNQRVRKVDAQTGLVSTVAGNGTTGFSGDGGPAVNAQLDHPTWLLADKENHLYISDYNNLRVRRMDLVTGIITTVAGNGTENYVSGARADQTGMLPIGLAFDRDGNLYLSQHPGKFASFTTNIISKVDKLTGVVTTVAGNGQYAFAGDGGAAMQASFFYPMGICFDAANNLYVADNLNKRVRKVDAVSGIITTIAGNGSATYGFSDGSLAVQVALSNPTDVKIDPSGNLVIVDFNQQRISKLTLATGAIATIAGNGYFGFGANCVLPTATVLGGPRVAAFDANGNLCFTDQDFHRIRSIINGTVPGISIAASSNDVCLQDSITFSAITTGTSFQSIYQWKKNGVNVGTNSAIYTDTFSKNEVVVCVLTPLTCGNATITSSPYTVTGSPAPAPVVKIEATAVEICKGTPVTFTAVNVSGNLKPRFDWYINSQVVATDTAVFSTGSLANGDIVQCLMTVQNCGAGTASAYSNSYTASVYTSLHPTVSIQAASTTVCKGTPAQFTTTALQAGNAPVYQWKINGNPVGGNSVTFETNSLKDGDVVSCAVTTTETSNNCLPVQTVNSNQVVMKIQKPTDPGLTIAALAVSVCEGDSIQLLAVLTPAVPTPVFKWQVNNTTVTGGNLFTIRHAATGDRVTCSVDVSGCTVSPTINSNQVSLPVQPLPVVDLIPADTTVSGGAAVQLRATVTDPGFSYSWFPADKLQSSAVLNPVTVPLQVPATFQLNVISDAGCLTIKEAIIRVNSHFYMPAAFSPNADGRNDVFRIPPSVYFQLEDFSIFDRWGNKIFTTSDISKGWDGTYHGKKLENGAYIFMITGRDTKGIVKQKGTVVLMR
jgi:gliding motility-associated-like protein